MFDIITFGTASRDVFLRSSLFKAIGDPIYLCFALGSKIEVDTLLLTTGGGAANTAVTFARQGLKTAVLAKIGDDEAGESLVKELRKENIHSFLIKEKDRKTAYSTILLEPAGERTILVYRGASEDLKLSEIPFNKLKTRWIYISPGKISFNIIKKIIDYFYNKKTLIAFNPSQYFLEMGIKKIKPLLAKSKVVILNREEAAYLTRINYQKEKAIFKKLDAIVDGLTVMTEGKKGVLVSDGYYIYRAKNFKERTIVDRTGAGDAFGSGFVAGLIQKRETGEKGPAKIDNIKYAIRLGSANATSELEEIGAKTGTLTKKDFEENKRWQKPLIKVVKLR
jgi:sugar/nucleoside kinase (ribokinase family)